MDSLFRKGEIYENQTKIRKTGGGNLFQPKLGAFYLSHLKRNVIPDSFRNLSVLDSDFRQNDKMYGKVLAFTLAEVLITLGIIGVVAAMTIPTLMANINGLKFRNQFKKSISTLNQAVRMNIANYDFDFSSTHNGITDSMNFYNIFNINLSGYTYIPHLSDLKVKSGSKEIPYESSFEANSLDLPAFQYMVGYLLSDGSLVGIIDDNHSCELPIGKVLNEDSINNYDSGHLAEFCLGFIDVNGTALPNKEVSCSDPKDETKLAPDKPCVVKNDSKHMTDIFPIIFHDGTVEPVTNAAKYVLETTK